jgi:hypothetical protein
MPLSSNNHLVFNKAPNLNKTHKDFQITLETSSNQLSNNNSPRINHLNNKMFKLSKLIKAGNQRVKPMFGQRVVDFLI